MRQTEGCCGRRTCTWAKGRGGKDDDDDDNTTRILRNPLTHTHTDLKKKRATQRPQMHALSDVCSMLFSLSHIHFRVSTNSAINPLNTPLLTLSLRPMTLLDHHPFKPPQHRVTLCAVALRMNFRGPGREGGRDGSHGGWCGGEVLRSKVRGQTAGKPL